jgi:uncharacterized protein
VATDPDNAVIGGALSEREAAFIEARDSFYLATVSETGWPYVQHRGGPLGFVRRVDDKTIGWADFADNRQYVSTGNAATDDRVAMIFMDYPHQRRLKILGHMRAYDISERPDLASRLTVNGYKGRVERFVLSRSIRLELPPAHHPAIHSHRNRSNGCASPRQNC